MIPPCEFDASGHCKRHLGNPHEGAEQRMYASGTDAISQAWRAEMDRLHGVVDYGAVVTPVRRVASKPCRGCLGEA